MASHASGRPLLAALGVEHPEWRPLLLLIEAALSGAERHHWGRFVPARVHQSREGRPLLDGAVISVAPKLIERWGSSHPGARGRRRDRSEAARQRGCGGLTFAAGYVIATPHAPDWRLWLMALATGAVMLRTRVSLLWLLTGGAVLGGLLF